MYEINYGIEERKNIALINVGASTANISILQNGLPVFTRDSAIRTVTIIQRHWRGNSEFIEKTQSD